MADAKQVGSPAEVANVALDQLLAGPFADFVSTRDRLAGERRRAGDKLGAEAIKKLAKPARSVWAVNRAIRAAPEAAARLFALTDALAEAQLFAKGADGRRHFQETTAAHRDAVAALVEAARQALAGEGQGTPPALLEQVANDFRFGALDREVRPSLAAARLLHDVETPGFGVFAGPLESAGDALAARAQPDPANDGATIASRAGDPARAQPADAAARQIDARRAEEARKAEDRRPAEERRAEIARLRAAHVTARKRRDDVAAAAKRSAATVAEADSRVEALERELGSARAHAEHVRDTHTAALAAAAEAEASERAAAAAIDALTRG